MGLAARDHAPYTPDHSLTTPRQRATLHASRLAAWTARTKGLQGWDWNCRQIQMEAKRIGTVLVLCLMPVVLATGQDKSGDSLRSDLEAVKAELKSQQDRIERLSQEITKLSEALKQKAPSSAVSPEPTPSVPRAAPVSTPASTPAAAGVESPVVAEAANLRSHTVLKGETLSQIAKQYGVSVPEIEQLNKIGDAKKLQAGQTIKIPPSTAASPSPSPTPQGQ